MPNGLDDLDRAADERRRRTRTPPQPRNPRAQRPVEPPAPDQDTAGLKGPRQEEWGGIGSALETPAAIASLLPAPHEPLSNDPALIPAERDELERCETALRAANVAFWVRGRMLQTIRDGDLYRETHSRFNDYCLEVWEVTARRANQLIEAWPLAEHLMLILGTIVPKININEGQVRALLSVQRRHGKEAAAFVYETIARSSVKVTATTIEAAIAVLPPDRFNRDEVARLLRDFLAGGVRALPAATSPPPSLFVAERRRLEKISEQVVGHAHEDPEAARLFAEVLAQSATRIRSQLE